PEGRIASDHPSLRRPARSVVLITEERKTQHGTRTRSAGAIGARLRIRLRNAACAARILADALRIIDPRIGTAASGIGAAGLRPRSPPAGPGCRNRGWRYRRSD